MSREPLAHPDAALPGDINPGIVRTVKWLRSHGFATCDSGDGVTHAHSCDRDHAYVVIRAEGLALITESLRLCAMLRAVAIEVVPQAQAFDDGGLIAPCVQASYDPADGIALIDLMGVCDSMLPEVLP